MLDTRKPAVAGTFYPEDKIALEDMVGRFLSERDPYTNTPPKAIIAPHAGYKYSGSVAASVYRLFYPLKNKIKRAVIFGSAHRVAFEGIALSSANYWQSPLGKVRVDKEACIKLADMSFVKFYDTAHRDEHSIEVHIPFLQMVLQDFSIVPVLACMTSTAEAFAIINELFDEETIFIISSDFSHYLGYNTCQEVDAKTVKAIENLDSSKIKDDNVCGLVPISGLIEVAKKQRMVVKALDVRNSGDTSGIKDKVVGYAAFGFWEKKNSV